MSVGGGEVDVQYKWLLWVAQVSVNTIVVTASGLFHLAIVAGVLPDKVLVLQFTVHVMILVSRSLSIQPMDY